MSIDFRLHVLKHFPKFQGKILIIMDERWVQHSCSYGNYSKYHMRLNLLDSFNISLRNKKFKHIFRELNI